MSVSTSLLAALSAVVVLTSSCASDAAEDVQDPAPEPSSTTTNAPSNTMESGPLTTIPPDVRLTHEGTWAAGDPVHTDALPEMCVDPGPDLYPPRTTDQRNAHGTSPDGAGRGESLGLFNDNRSAARAIAVWRLQTARCGHGLDHAGNPQDWIVREVVVSGADEAWQSSDTASGRTVTFTTAARVGNAVFVETARHEGRFDEGSIAAMSDTEIASVTAYVPTLVAIVR